MENFPTAIRPDEVEFYLVSNALEFTSPFTQSQDIAELAGDRWFATLSFRNLVRIDSDVTALLHFMAALRGRVNSFFLWDHSRETPVGSAGGTPVVNGASQTGTTLATSGWPLSTNGILLPGDRFEVGGELKEIDTQADSDGSGNATLSFFPPIRFSPADSAALTVNSPKATFRLASASEARPRHRGPLVDLSFTAVESF